MITLRACAIVIGGALVAAACSCGERLVGSGCTASSECSKGLYCSKLTGVCTNTDGRCLSSGDCSADPARKVCDAASEKCVGCLAAADCPTDRPQCSPQKTCAACLGDDDCAAGSLCVESTCVPGCSASHPACPPRRVCDTRAGKCVDCAQDDDCPEGQVCRKSACLVGCSAATPRCPLGLVCDGASGGCVACLSDAHCKDPLRPRCNLAAQTCVECVPAADTCPTTTACASDFTCRPGCKNDLDCAAVAGKTQCDLAARACVECVNDAPCPVGKVCDVAAHTCASGCSAIQPCPAGQGCCSGACVDLSTASNCGACGKACGVGEGCCGGQCASISTAQNCGGCGASCGVGSDCCGGTCTAVYTALNCGACGRACASSQDCCGGTCVSLTTVVNCGACGNACGPGKDCCAGICTAITTAANCGACGNACPAGQTCVGGLCATCAAGQTPCSGTCVDTQDDPAHCGGCNKPCQQNETCAGGSCVAPASCAALKQQKPGRGDGAYTLDPDGPGGSAPLPLYCDMTTDGAGWTLVYKTNQSSSNERTDSGYNTGALASNAIDAVAVLPRATVALIGNAFRIQSQDASRKLYWTGAPFYTTDNHVGKIYSPLGKLSWSAPWVPTYYELNGAHGICVGTGGAIDWAGLEHMCTQRWCCGLPNAGIWYNFGSFNPGAVHPGSAWATTIPTSGSDGKTQLTAGNSCRQVRDDGFSTGDGVYWVDFDGGAKSNALQVWCDMSFEGGGWTFVRRQRPGVAWADTPNDNLGGGNAYGSYKPDTKVNASFGAAFNRMGFGQFLFRTGDGVKWLVTDSGQVYFNWNGTCGPGNAIVTKSHVQATSYAVGWCKRPGVSEDPWISAQDHGFGGASCANDNDTHSMLYGESYPCWAYYTNNRNGVNVYVR